MANCERIIKNVQRLSPSSEESIKSVKSDNCA